MEHDNIGSARHAALSSLRCGLPMRLVGIFLALICTAYAADCAVSAEAPFQDQVRWEELFRGVWIANLQADSPRPIKAHCVRIRLDEPGIAFLATPGNGDLSGETTALRTSTFLRKYKVQVAINAGPFSPVANLEGVPQDVIGVHVSGNRLVSPWDEKLPAVLISRTNRVIFVEEPTDLSDVENAVGGFNIVLRNGKVVPGDNSLHPRTAAGVSADGKTLVLLVIDGRQKGYSEGATTAEVGTWLQALGCSAGINLDGGGSTTLVIEDQQGQPRIVNRPIHGGIPGLQRPVGSHLGIWADKLHLRDKQSLPAHPAP